MHRQPASQPTKEPASRTILANVQMYMLFSNVSVSISQSRSDAGFRTKMVRLCGGNNEMNVVKRVYDDAENSKRNIGTGRRAVPPVLHTVGNSVEWN